MEKPTRWHIAIIATIWFMIVATMFAEGNRHTQIAAKHKKPAAVSVAPVPVPESVPVPIPTDKPKEAPKKK